MIKAFPSREAAEAHIRVHLPGGGVEPKEIEVLAEDEIVGDGARKSKRVWALYAGDNRYLDEAGGYVEVEE
jgi:hypothetical protein